MTCENCRGPRRGDAVQYKVYPPGHTFAGQRLGGEEPKVLEYISDQWVIYSATSAQGEYLGEAVISRAEFDSRMERVR
jgi:hypothetical protein